MLRMLAGAYRTMWDLTDVCRCYPGQVTLVERVWRLEDLGYCLAVLNKTATQRLCAKRQGPLTPALAVKEFPSRRVADPGRMVTASLASPGFYAAVRPSVMTAGTVTGTSQAAAYLSLPALEVAADLPIATETAVIPAGQPPHPR